MPFLIGLFTSAIGKYLVIAAVALGAITWIRHDAKAPYQREISALRSAAAQKDRLLLADAARAEIDRAEKERLEATIEAIAHEARLSPTACKLSPAELERLYQLSAGRGGRVAPVSAARR